jgi:hypothetical protein
MAAIDRTEVFSQTLFGLSLSTKGWHHKTTEFESLDEALAALKAEGASCAYTSPHGSWDSVHEVRYETWVESVLRGRPYYREGNYDWLTFSPIWRVHWFGQPIALMDLRPHGHKLEDTAKYYRGVETARGQWWLERYEGALQDPTVWKTLKGKVLIDGKAELTVEERCIDLYGPP